MTYKPMSETISFLLAGICKAHRGYANDLLAGIGLHVGQEMILCRLWQSDGLTQSELAEHLGVQLPTVNKMLSRMEKNSLVERCTDSRDCRISRVYLTEKGRAMQEPTECIWRKLEACTVAEFTVAEQLLLRRLLLQIYDNLVKRA